MSFPSAEEQEAGGGFTFLQLWYMLRAHQWLSIGIFVLMAGASFVAIKTMTKSYDATATLIVNADNTDPLAGRSSGGTGNFISTQVELIYNSVMLLPVIDRLKLRTDSRYTQGFVGDAKALNDMLLDKLRGAVYVRPGKGSQLLYISATAHDPVQAADIANAVADEYLLQTGQRINAPAVERATRYTAQLAELQQKVSQAQARVAAFRQRNGMTDLSNGASGDLESAELGNLQAQLLTAQNARRQLEAQRVDTRADSTEVLEAPEALALRAKLGELEGRMGQARATKGPRHPDILQLQSEIDATNKALQTAVRARYNSSALQLARARELEGKYQAAATAERKRLLDRRGIQDDGAALLLEQRLAEEAYAQALRGLDAVQFASAGNYQDVTLVSRAEPPLRANSSNKLKLFAMAIMASFALAVGGPFAYELFFNRRIRCRDDLERHFRVVMLAQFGRMPALPPAA
jgi:uncharacterized protein involved in exopolysaccharide biosynthesis